MITIETRDFGTLELDESELLTFRSPIYGYEDLNQFAILTYPETGAGIAWLQSVENPDICFVILDPDEIQLDYDPDLPAEVVELLGQTGPVAFRLIAIIPEDFRETTVNLKSPIVINTEKRLAAQVILDGDYPIRMRIMEAQEETSC